MSQDGWIVTGILLATVAAFGWGRARPEVITLAAVGALGLSRIATPTQAFAGFGDPATVTVALVFVLSAAMERTGLAYRAARSLVGTVGGGEGRLLAALMLLAGALTGVMNNIGAMAVLMPVAVAVAREAQLSPARLLMPLAIAIRQGGALTLVAGPSNLVVSGLLAAAGFGALRFFSYLPVGLALLAVTVAFMLTAGRRLLPVRPAPPHTGRLRRRDLPKEYRLAERLFRLRVDEDSPLASRTLAQTALGHAFRLHVLAIQRGRRRIVAPLPTEQVLPGDVLVVQGRPEDLERLQHLGPIEVVTREVDRSEPLETEAIGLVEVVLAPRSELAGKTLRDLEFRQRYGLNVVAIWREGRPYRTGLGEQALRYGDALLVQGPRDRLRALRADPSFVVLEEPEAPRTARVGVAAGAVLVLIVLASTGAVPVALAALLAAGVAVTGGAVTVEEAIGAVDWRTVIVIGGLLPLGAALNATGAAAAIARAGLAIAGSSPLSALVASFTAAMVIGHVVPSIPTTILLAPIALDLAQALGANPVPFMIVISCASSTTLLTPISHPVSLMIMGPGDYRFGDYVRVGAPLAVLLSVTLVAVAVLVWGL
ncbi:MAG: SLC13 family permease [Armatimonadota bacterium]|nr:SLC13 family permease [Armatimonadota bacterium]MDR7533820.1 SLC13 family permease [Armatimonadota bacterium]MDR7536651.1 SLC13 family permease [Armatimonadota bacterium]